MSDLIFMPRTTFCGNLSYRFDADQVELQADIAKAASKKSGK